MYVPGGSSRTEPEKVFGSLQSVEWRRQKPRAERDSSEILFTWKWNMKAGTLRHFACKRRLGRKDVQSFPVGNLSRCNLLEGSAICPARVLQHVASKHFMASSASKLNTPSAPTS